MSSGIRKPIGQVLPAAAKLFDQLAPVCAELEIAGSVRRFAADPDRLVGDLELVAISKPEPLQFGVPADLQRKAIDRVLHDMIKRGQVRRDPPNLARYAWGPKYKKLWIPVGGHWFQVDLFLAVYDNFGVQFMTRTGPAEFSKAMAIHARYRTPFVHQDGYLKRKADGAIVPVPTERSYFDAVGIEWIPPSKRTGPADLVIVRDFANETDAETRAANLAEAQRNTNAGGQLTLF